jgi:hypothetical protein
MSRKSRTDDYRFKSCMFSKMATCGFQEGICNIWFIVGLETSKILTP